MKICSVAESSLLIFPINIIERVKLSERKVWLLNKYVAESDNTILFIVK